MVKSVVSMLKRVVTTVKSVFTIRRNRWSRCGETSGQDAVKRVVTMG